MSTLTSLDEKISSENTRSASTTHTGWSASPRAGSGKETFVRRLFDTISPGYDRFNRIASLGFDRSWRRRTVQSLNLQPGMCVLDLASGTGDLAHDVVPHLAPLGMVAALDLSFPMLTFASKKLAKAPLARWHVKLAQGRAETLPFRSGSFDAATMGFALRNVTDLNTTFRELFRVIRPGGRIGLLEFGRPKNWVLRIGFRLWLLTGIPLMGMLTTFRLWPFAYLRRSILQFLIPEEVVSRLEAAGFAQVRVESFMKGVALLYRGTVPVRH